MNTDWPDPRWVAHRGAGKSPCHCANCEPLTNAMPEGAIENLKAKQLIRENSDGNLSVKVK